MLDDVAATREARVADIQTAASQLRDLDYASAVARMNQQMMGLQAAQQMPPVRVLPAAAYAKALVDFASAAELRRYHDLIAMEPHVAGTVGDVRQIERIKQAFEAMNRATRVERFRCLLSRPISASLEIVDDGAEPAAAPSSASCWPRAPCSTSAARPAALYCSTSAAFSDASVSASACARQG